MDESAIRISMLEQRWAKPTSGDIYEEDVVCDFPQSGERIRGRTNLIAQRSQTQIIRAYLKCCG